MDRFNQITAGSLGVAITRQPSVVRVAWDLGTIEPYPDSNLPMYANSDRVRIVVGRDVHVPVAIEDQGSYQDNPFIPENQFLFTSALTSSALEHNALMQVFTGKQAASVARVIEMANDPNNDPNNPVYTITTFEDANTLTADGNSLVGLPTDVKEYIKNAANADCEITIPKTAVQIADSNYVGYIARDIETSASDFVLYDVELDKIASGELKETSLIPEQLIITSDPTSDPNGYAALENVVDLTAAWLKVTEDATTNAGLSYLPAIIDINRWFQSRTELDPTELDPVTTVASVLAVTNPITRLSVHSAILNVQAGSGTNGTIRNSRSNWVSADANEFIINADVTRDAQWQANIYRYGESTPHLEEVDGNEPNLVAVFTFAGRNDGYYRYVLTAGSDANEATAVEGTFHVDLTEPNATITEANLPDPNTLGMLVVEGTTSDDYFDYYKVYIGQDGNETEVYSSNYSVTDNILCEVSTLDFNDVVDTNVILKVWDLAGNIGEAILAVDINNPDPPDTTPPDLNLSAVWDGNEIDANTYVDGKIKINIDPNETVKKIRLWLCDENGENCQFLDEQVDPNNFPFDPNQWSYDMYTYLYENGPATIMVEAWDSFGNYTNESQTFFNDSTISNLRVTPTVVTPSNTTLTVSASFKESSSWTLTIKDPNNEVFTDANGESISVSKVFDVNTNWYDGTYIAEINIPATDANTTFAVALKPPSAAISNPDLVIQTNSNTGIPDSTPVIDEGLYDLIGEAYHTDSNNVSYKIELYMYEIKNYTSDFNDWHLFDGTGGYPDFSVANITPGTLNGDNFREQAVQAGGSLGTLDFTGIENGAYQMLLTVKCNDSNAYDSAEFVLDCPLKVGYVKFSQEDLVVPISGIPMRVVRTYDGLNKDTKGDFGYGWTYSIANMDIELNERRYGTTRIGDEFDRNVTLTLPDGERTTFNFNLVGSLAGTGGEWQARYDSPDGVSAMLTTKETEKYMMSGIGDTAMVWWYPHRPIYWIQTDLRLHDFSGFKLITEDYTVYNIDRKSYGTRNFECGLGIPWFSYESYGQPYLSSIETASGEKIEFEIDLSNGENPIVTGIIARDREDVNIATIGIIRDENDRIIAIRDPGWNQGDANTIEYVYDGNDNLTEVWRLVDKDTNEYDVTEYTYDNPSNHLLTDINDPRGLTPIRYVYDANGILTGTIDAKGNTINITHNITGRTETIEDRLGYLTIYEYDERGNVISVTNAQGDTTSYQYTDSTNPDKATIVTFPSPSGPTTYYEYDSLGRTTKVTDPVGNVTTYSYDNNGNLLETVQKVPDPQNANVLKEISRTTNEYNVQYPDRNLLEKTSDALGNSTVYEYDSKNRMTRIIKEDPNGFLLEVITTNTYDDNSNFPTSPISTTDAAEFTRHFEYDENGNQIKSWYYWEDPNDSGNNCKVYTITEYDAMGRVVKTIRDVNNVNGNVTPSTVTLSEMEYNLIGKPDITINEHDVMTVYEYDQLGNLVETKVYDSNDADVNDIRTITETLYDAEGRAIVTTDPHDPCDPNVNGTQTIYDALGRVTETIRWENVVIPVEDIVVDGNVVGRTNLYDLGDNNDPNWSQGDLLTKTVTEYDFAGRVFRTKTFDENGVLQTTEYEYDAAGRQTAVIDANGNRTEYEYEGNRRTLVRDARAFEDTYANRYKYETSFEYDKLGRLRYTDFSDGTYTYVGYDNLGRKSSETDQAGRTRWFDYDSAGRLTAVILPEVDDPNNGDTPTYPRYEYKYDKYGNLTAIWDNVKEDPETGSVNYDYKRVTTFTYNHLHKQTSRTLPNGETEYKEYDEYGRLVKATDFIGQVTSFSYDDPNAAGLLHYQKFYDSNSYYDSNPNDPNLSVHFTYDELSRKTHVDVNDEGTEYVYQYWYDDEGRVYRTFSPQGYVNYEFSDLTGRRVSVYTPTGTADTEIDYYYDQLGRLEQVKVDKRNSQDVDEDIYYTYNAVGSLATVTYPNNVTTYTYDSLNRLTDVNIYDGSDTLIASYDYELSSCCGTWDRAVEDVNGQQTIIDYAYDNLKRLTWIDYNAPGEANDFTHSYVYDLVGNRLQKNVTGGHNTVYTYDPNNDRLLSETTDNNSITYTYDDNGSLIIVEKDNDANLDYYYDIRGRLCTVEVENGSAVDYLYSPDGIRVRATIDGNDIDYLIDQYNHTGYAQVFKEINEDTDANTIYVLGHDVLAQATGANAPKYMLYDGHGSVRHLTNSAGNITDSFNYDAYGNAHGFSPVHAELLSKSTLLQSRKWQIQ
ncbi:MAG: hypothetical protein ACYS9Y_09705 [Planctomycetota bacterium]|jgi:YD repeat-containing protein